jgi:outer membrane protein OmpA-like peptidoglycan-associated protein
MKRSRTALVLLAALPAALLSSATLAGPQYTAEEIIEHFSRTPADPAAKPATRGVFIGAAGFGSEAGAAAAATQGATGADAAVAAQQDATGAQTAGADAGSRMSPGDQPLAIPMTGAKAGLATQGGSGVGQVAAATSEPPAASVPDAGSYDLLITFDLDSATLTRQARENLDAFVAALQSRALAPYRFAVDGHTDATGPTDYNQKLSERRAASVVDYLVAHGVEGDRLVAHGYGETRPRLGDNPNDAENRRVETRRIE